MISIVISVSPRLHSLQELQVHLGFPASLENFLENLVTEAAKHDEKPSVVHVDVTDGLALEEHALVVLLQHRRDGLQVGRRRLIRLISAVLLYILFQRFADSFRAGRVPVFVVDLVQQQVRDP